MDFVNKDLIISNLYLHSQFTKKKKNHVSAIHRLMNPHVHSNVHICTELNLWHTYASSPAHNDAVNLDVTASVSNSHTVSSPSQTNHNLSLLGSGP
jgi:predicted cupin superfamily sugar epimerase